MQFENKLFGPPIFGLTWAELELKPLPSLSNNTTGCCPICNMRVFLRSDGSISCHIFVEGNHCEGTGEPPVPDTLRTPVRYLLKGL